MEVSVYCIEWKDTMKGTQERVIMYAAEDDVEGRVIVHATALSRSRVDYVLSFQRSYCTLFCS